MQLVMINIIPVTSFKTLKSLNRLKHNAIKRNYFKRL